MPGYAPLFGDNATNVPVNTNPLTSRRVRNALNASTIGAAAGGATAASKARVKHPGNNTAKDLNTTNLIETDTEINRNSTAADVTAMKTAYTKKKASFAFARDLSGNGGPAFTRS